MVDGADKLASAREREINKKIVKPMIDIGLQNWSRFVHLAFQPKQHFEVMQNLYNNFNQNDRIETLLKN